MTNVIPQRRGQRPRTASAVRPSSLEHVSRRRVDRHYSMLLGALLVLLGTALLLFQLNSVSLRGDEAFAAQYWAGLPLVDSLRTIATLEPHAPFTYLLFSGWGLSVGTASAFALRLFPALWGILGVAVFFRLAVDSFSAAARVRQQYNNRYTVPASQPRLEASQLTFGLGWAALATLFWVINPFAVWHSQDFRNYIVWLTISQMSLLLLLRLLRHPGQMRLWMLYAALSVIASLVFYFQALFTLAACVAGWLMLRRYRSDSSTSTLSQPVPHNHVVRWLMLHIVLLAIPVAIFLVLQGSLIAGGLYSGTTDLFNLQALATMPAVLLFGQSLPADALIGLGVVSWLLLGLIAISAVIARLHTVGLLLIWAGIPALLLIVITTRFAVFLPRYIIAAAPALLLTLFLTGWHLWQRPSRVRAAGRAVVAIIGLIVISVTMLSLTHYLFDPAYRKAPDWAAFDATLTQSVEQDDLVIQRGIDPAFAWYYRGSAPEIALPASPRQPDDAIVRALQDASMTHTSLWLVGKPTDWPNQSAVDEWLAANMQVIRRFIVDDLPATQYGRYDAIDTASLSPTTDAPRFVVSRAQGDADVSDTDAGTDSASVFATLRDVSVYRSTNDDLLSINLVWQFDAAFLASDTVSHTITFAHLVGPVNPASSSPLWAQDDHPVHIRGIALDDDSHLSRDHYELSLRGLEAGTYQIQVGFYERSTVERYRTASGDDAISVYTIQVRASE